MNVVELEILNQLLSGIAEEMGVVLRRSAFSPNIRERCDFSCAIFDEKGELCAQASHIPVHLGAMPETMKHLRNYFHWKAGDIAITNDPYQGGTHLPDITVVKPLFYQGRLRFFLVVRAHHADVGGRYPGSMAPTTHIEEEGVIIPPSLIIERGRLNTDLWEGFLKRVRNPVEREGDLKAQLASLERGERRLIELLQAYGEEKVLDLIDELKNYSERAFLKLLSFSQKGKASFTDYLDDDGFSTEKIPIKVEVSISEKRALVDFTGTSKMVKGPVNAPRAVALSAVYYVFFSLLSRLGEYPINEGILRRIEVITPEGSLVNAQYPAPVSAGNVETSQRIVDALLGALAELMPEFVQAASCGSMNNVAFGNEVWAYYETIGGGMGGRLGLPGLSGVHTHMTNTMNTPIEVLESIYPVRIERYALRKGSGGLGKYPGGDGLVRTYLFLEELEVSLLTDRRKTRPYGLFGGLPGKAGINYLLKKGARIPLPSKVSLRVKKGERISLYTPGGGGYGSINHKREKPK